MGEPEDESTSDLGREADSSTEVQSGAVDAAGEILDWLIEATRATPAGSEPRDALEQELSAGLASSLSAREHMLDLITLARDGLLPELDSDHCRILAVMLTELSAWVAEYDV
jgi:hypothetical protein